MEYGMPEKRKTRRDKRAKRKKRVYKRGGKYRGTKVGEGIGKK